jgi:AraC-like DNA-binding protein
VNIHIEQREAQTPHVRSIWRATSTGDGQLIGKADSSWGFILLRHEGAIRISLSGPTTQAKRISYHAGMEFFGVCFQLGVSMPHYAIGSLVDRNVGLPNATQSSFWLDDTACPFPDYDNVEAFVEKLLQRGLLARDRVVEDALAGRAQSLTPRTVQRHFRRTTGLTQSTIARIERARAAAEHLKRGEAVLDVVHTAGYADQPHLTNTLKRLIGRTPAQLAGLKPSESMSF